MQVSYSFTCLHILYFVLLAFSASAEKCNPFDKNVLLHIKSQFNTTDDFGFFDMWNSNNSKCCTDWSGVQCNAKGRVTSLGIQLSSSSSSELTIPSAIGYLPYLAFLRIKFFGNLTGTIPESFARLTQLQRLELATNSLSGPVPAFLGRLTKLTYLDLSLNSFTGSLPPSLGRLTSLTYLDVSTNKLSGPIPESLGNLKNLIFFDLSSNRLSGPIPSSLSNLSKATQIDLRANRLTGSIPASFGLFKKPLLLLFLSQNRLSGQIPRSLGHANISLLDLSMNKLSGDASFLFGKDKTVLDTIYLNDNNFFFDFTNVVFPIGLRNLDIRKNRIYGSLPKQLGQLPLSVLDVSYNWLCGEIPTGRRLKRFSPDNFAHNKCLCGVPLPPCK